MSQLYYYLTKSKLDTKVRRSFIFLKYNSISLLSSCGFFNFIRPSSFTGVVILTTIANRFRLHRINGVEQFILAYGGLRGAVAFALVLIVSDRIIPTKNMMVTTIIALVFFTVFIQVGNLNWYILCRQFYRL